MIDLARYLVGEVASVTGLLKTFVPQRGDVTVDVDDAFEATVEFENGAVGTLEASRFARGRKNGFSGRSTARRGRWSSTSSASTSCRSHPGNGRANGFRTVLVSEADHPFWEHVVAGRAHSSAGSTPSSTSSAHLLTAIRDDADVAPHGATLEDGYRASEVAEAIVRSSESGQRQAVDYRTE